MKSEGFDIRLSSVFWCFIYFEVLNAVRSPSRRNSLKSNFQMSLDKSLSKVPPLYSTVVMAEWLPDTWPLLVSHFRSSLRTEERNRQECMARVSIKFWEVYTFGRTYCICDFADGGRRVLRYVRKFQEWKSGADDDRTGVSRGCHPTWVRRRGLSFVSWTSFV